MENLILAALDLGLGTCWMLAPLWDEAVFRKILDISNDKEIVGITPLGYPDMIAKPIPRLDTELKSKVYEIEVLHVFFGESVIMPFFYSK